MHILELLARLENYRQKMESGELTPGTHDHTIRMCQAHVAELSDFRDRADWVESLRSRKYLNEKGEVNRVQERLEIFYNRLRMDEIRVIYEGVFAVSLGGTAHVLALTDIIAEIGSDNLEKMIMEMR